MYFSIDTASDVAIYEQIVRQVKFAVADGVLASGQMVPSVRQLAAQLAINPNTIARAYGQLQTDGVLKTIRGRGLVIRADAAKRCAADRNDVVADALRRAVADALRGGLTPDQTRQIFEHALAQRAGVNGQPKP